MKIYKIQQGKDLIEIKKSDLIIKVVVGIMGLIFISQFEIENLPWIDIFNVNSPEIVEAFKYLN